MLAQPHPLCRFVQLLGLLAGLASLGALGLAGGAGDGARMALGLLAALLLLAAMAGLARLARMRTYKLPEFERALAGAVLGGVAFLAAVYHLPGVLREFAIIHVAIDALLPAWAGHALGLAPGVLIILAAGRVLRHVPGSDGFRAGGRLRNPRRLAGQDIAKSKGGLHG